MEGIVFCVGATEPGLAGGMLGAQHVVEGHNVVVAKTFGGLGPVANDRWVVPDFGGGKDGS